MVNVDLTIEQLRKTYHLSEQHAPVLHHLLKKEKEKKNPSIKSKSPLF